MQFKNGQTTIQFYAGLKTIGGTIFEIKYKEERFIADFGMVFQNNMRRAFNCALNMLFPIYKRLGVIPFNYRSVENG